jgi:hypothetical protein
MYLFLFVVSYRYKAPSCCTLPWPDGLILGLLRVVSLLRWRIGSLRLRRLVTVLRKLIIGLRGLLLGVGLLILILLLLILLLLILLLLLLLLCRRRSRHVHTLLLSLVALGDRSLREARLDFVVLLDKSTAETPVTDAAIVHATTLDAESLTDFTTLHHGVTRSRVLVDSLNKTLVCVLHPTAASYAVDCAKDESIAVAGIGSLHSRVSHTIGGFTQDYGENC